MNALRAGLRIVIIAAALTGCGGHGSSGSGGLVAGAQATATPTTATTSPVTTAATSYALPAATGQPLTFVGPSARLYADVNRDGVINSADDQGRDQWSSSRGAIFVWDNDDSASRHALNCTDSVINGPGDAETMTHVIVGQLTSNATSVTLSYSPLGAPVRVFARDVNNNWDQLLAPGVPSGTLPVSQVAQQPIDLLLQGAGPRSATWDGTVTVTLTVDAAQVTSDSIMFREAPIIEPDNTQPAVRVYCMMIDDPTQSPNIPFWNALSAGLAGQGIELDGVDETTYDFDRWVQDGMQLGYQAYIGASGYTWMDDFNQLERDDGIPGLFSLVPDQLLAQNQGMSYGGAQQPEDSPNYGGNLEVLPPYTDPIGANWPFGRLYHGGGDQGLIDGTAISRHMNSNETALLEAQGMQGPFIEISTEWLDVGHVDEISMVVADPSNTNNRPWKLLWASPTLAVSALAQLQSAGQGSAVIFNGRPEQTTVDAVLGDATLMSFNDGVQARLDSNKALLEQTVGLTDADFIEVPVLYETIVDQGLNFAVAMSPGVQNCIPVNTTLYVPDPNGPQSNGQDVWQAQVLAAVTPLGLGVTFVDVYTSYHELEGEAHCGTNVRYEPYSLPWWER